MGFPCSSVGKESACSSGDPGLIPGPGRSPEKGNGNPLQYPCLMDTGVWWAAVHGVAKSQSQWGDHLLTYLQLTYNSILVPGVQCGNSVFLYPMPETWGISVPLIRD